jgi:nucleolar complex protein 3
MNAAKAGGAGPAHGRVAARCMAGLLAAAPHFNYASDLLQAVVPGMASPDPAARAHCCAAVAALAAGAMNGGDAGAAAVEAVQLVADLVRRRRCVAPPEVVSCLLGLTFPEIASGEDFEAAKRSRKAKKKVKKGKDDVSRAFLEAQAVADKDQRRGQQSAALEALFEVFFRVLKAATASGAVAGAAPGAPPLPASRFAKRFPLLDAALEGLARFSHLISVDYFSDLMAELELLAASSALPPAPRLRVLLTAARILRGQGEALTVDRRGFHVQLYAALERVQLEPLNEEERWGDDDVEGGRGDIAAAGGAGGGAAAGGAPRGEAVPVPVLLSQLLESMILDSKLLDAARQAAFAKRAAGAAGAAADAGAAMGLLCVLQRMLRRQPRLRGMLAHESGGPAGQRGYRPDIADPAEAAALGVALWELVLLSSHYHPHVAHAARDVAAMGAAPAANAGGGGGGGGVLPLASSPAELAARYSAGAGGFRPPPAAPPPPRSKAAAAKAARPASAAQRGQLEEPAAEAFAAAVCAAAAGGYEAEAAQEAAAAAAQQAAAEALARHFRSNRLHQRNAELRREHGVVAAQLRRFHEHVQAQQAQQAQQEAKAQRAAGKAAKAEAKAAKPAKLKKDAAAAKPVKGGVAKGGKKERRAAKPART